MERETDVLVKSTFLFSVHFFNGWTVNHIFFGFVYTFARKFHDSVRCVPLLTLSSFTFYLQVLWPWFNFICARVCVRAIRVPYQSILFAIWIFPYVPHLIFFLFGWRAVPRTFSLLLLVAFTICYVRKINWTDFYQYGICQMMILIWLEQQWHTHSQCSFSTKRCAVQWWWHIGKAILIWIASTYEEVAYVHSIHTSLCIASKKEEEIIKSNIVQYMNHLVIAVMG